MLYPRIRSYVLRQGRITPSQRQALGDSWADYGLTINDDPFDLDVVFDRNAPRVLEIGFGNGESLLSQAATSPDKDFIGIEVHSPGVGHIIGKAKHLRLKNLRIIHFDAVEVLSCSIPDGVLDKIQIFFPDPWPKKRHHKRRLIKPEFVALLARKLKQSGVLHCATDWENYAEHMMQILSDSNDFSNVAGVGLFYPDPYSLRPHTKFEKRGIGLNHAIRDLVFKRG